MALTLNHNGYRMQLDARDAGAVGHVFPLIRDEESWTEVEIEIGGEDEKSASALPLMATASDVREIVKFLRKKPSGVTLVEAVEAMKKPTLDPRKMTAYEYWGLVTRSGDRIRLSPRGQAFARRLEPETEAFRELLRDTDLYRAALVWLRQEQSELITDSALAAYWQRHHREAIGAGNEKTVKANVACFFQLCQAAEFGTLTIGKRGQPTRLRVDQDELESYLSSGASVLPQTLVEKTSEPQPKAGAVSEPLVFRAPAPSPQAGDLRVFLSAPETGRAAKQVSDALDLAEIESELHARDGGASPLLPGPVMRAMRDCDAALFILSPADCHESEAGQAALNQNVLNELNAALALYDGQVALLWVDESEAPQGLETLTRFEVADGGLTLERGIEIVRAVKRFRPQRRANEG